MKLLNMVFICLVNGAIQICCASNAYNISIPSKTYFINGEIIQISLNSYDYHGNINSEGIHTSSTYIHAKLSFLIESRQVRQVNFDCLTLYINNNIKADEIYVDSIASVPTHYLMNNREVNLYWVYKNLLIDHISEFNAVMLPNCNFIEQDKQK